MNIIRVGNGCPGEMLEALGTARSFSDVFEQRQALSYHSECQVTVCRVKSSGQQVVVKTYLKHKLKGTSLLQVQTESQVHCTLSHPHIARMFVTFEDSRNIYMVVEYADGGDLRKHMGGRVERRIRDFIALPLLQVLAQLHQEGIVHRDLKPDNVLVHDGQVLLADFGLAMYTNEGSPFNQDMTEQAAACTSLADNAGGTPLYTAPEVLLAMFKSQPMQQVVQPKNDVWALGVMLVEALSGSHPFSPEHCSSYNGNVLYTIAHHKSICLPGNLSPELNDFLSQALQRDPELRPSAEDLLHHPWLQASARREGSGHCRALSAELSDSLESEPWTPEACTPASGGLSPFDLSSDGSPPKCKQSIKTYEDSLHSHMHRAYSAFDMGDCWEQ